MDFPECPFCYAPIHVFDDGTCPACRKNTLQAPAENRQYTAVEVTGDQILPACCILCGNDTNHTEHFEFRYDSHLGGKLDDQAYLAFVMIVICTVGIGLLFLPLYRRYLCKQRMMTYRIVLPLCRACLPKKFGYFPLTIEGNAFHLKVHKNFKTRLAACSSRQASVMP